MKKIFYFFSMILLAGAVSCSEDNTDPTDPGNSGEGGGGGDKPVSVQIEGTATLAMFALDGTAVGNNPAVWDDGDSFRLFDRAGEVTKDTKMSLSGVNGAAASFRGMAANVEGSRTFYAVYPYGSSVVDPAAYPVTMAAAQTGAGEFVAVTGAKTFTGNPDEDTPLVLEFKPVAAIWDITVANAEGKGIKGIKAMVDPDGSAAGTELFVTEGTIDLKAATVAVKPVVKSASVGVTFAAVQNGTEVAARIFLLPAKVEADLLFVVTLDDESTLTVKKSDFLQDFVAGTVAKSTIDLADAESGEDPEPEPDPDFMVVDGVLTSYLGIGGDITIPDGVHTIGTSVFEGNSVIGRVNLNQVKTIGKNAFKSSSITFADGPEVLYLTEEAFNEAKQLTEVNMPKLETSEAYTFQSSGLTEISLPSLVSVTGQRMFRLCASLQTVNLPKLTGDVPFQMFIDCKSLSSVNLPLVETVGVTKGQNFGQCFPGCPLTTLDLPEVTLLQWRAINCEALASLSVPKLATLEGESMAYLFALKYVSLPAMETIKANAFKTIKEMVVDLSDAVNLTAVGTPLFPNAEDVKVYVASEEKKALFVDEPNVTVIVGKPQ